MDIRYVTKGCAVPYNEEIHRTQIRKFLYWEKGDRKLLVTGPQPEHMHLWSFAEDQIPMDDLDSESLIGAGDASGGRIVGWQSSGLHVDTAESLRPIIAEALGCDVP